MWSGWMRTPGASASTANRPTPSAPRAETMKNATLRASWTKHAVPFSSTPPSVAVAVTPVSSGDHDPSALVIASAAPAPRAIRCRHAVAPEPVTAADGGVELNGTACFVQDARKVSFFVVSARAADGVGLFAVEADALGARIEPDHIVDLTRDQAHVELHRVRVPIERTVAPPGAGAAALADAMPALLTIAAADLCGAAEWQLQTTAAYARVRQQFDRPIGFFQAVKHPLVNMMLAIDQARSLVYNAACAIDTEPERGERCARMAKASASDTAAFCSGRSVQLHGGIGFTWECDVHLYFKRQLHNQLLFGDGAYQRAQLARLIDRG